MTAIVPPGEGEVISDSEERTLLIKLGRPDLALTWSRYEPGQSGPPPHIHREHSDCFYVLEGELTFELGVDGDPIRAGVGATVMVPPNVVHTFRCEGPAARFLNVHAPGSGFDDYLRALRDDDQAGVDRFDSFDPPEDGGRPPSEALIRPDGGGGRIPDLAIDALTLTPGSDIALRTAWIVDGQLTLDDDEAGPGSCVVVPAGDRVPARAGATPVRLLELIAPAP